MNNNTRVKNYNQYRRMFLFLFLFLLVSLTGCKNFVREVRIDDSSNEVAKETPTKEPSPVSKNGISMTADYGYSSSIKYGRYMNITVNLQNDNNKIDGSLEVILPNSDKDNLMYQKAITVEAHKKTSISMEVPLTNNLSYMYVKVLDNNKKELISKIIKLNIIAYSDVQYVGILSDDYSELSYLSNADTKTHYLSSSDIPTDALGLDTLDVIVINNYDTSLLNKNQVNAIEEWVINGGTLVIGTGENSNKTLAFLDSSFLTVKKSNLSKITTSFGLEQNDDVNISIEGKMENIQDLNLQIEKIADTTITKNRIDLSVEGAKADITENGKVLMYTSKKGNGSVDILTTDLNLESKVWDTIGAKIWDSIKASYSESKVHQLQMEKSGYTNEYRLFDAVSNPEVKSKPQIGWYIIILLLYIVFVGPILYIVLKRKEKRHLTWILVPVLSIIFTSFVYLIGSNTRIVKPYVGYVSILEMGKDNTATDRVYFSITTPFNKDYQFNFKDEYRIATISSNLYNYGYFDTIRSNVSKGYKTAVKNQNNGTTIQVKNYSAFTPTYYKSQSTHRMEGGIASELAYQGYNLTGTVKNKLGMDIDNAVLFNNHNIIAVGDMKSEAEINIAGKDKINVQSINTVYSDDKWMNKLFAITKNQKEPSYKDALKENVIKYAIENYLFSNNNVSYLVGFTNNENKEDVIDDLKLSNNGLQLVIIPIDVNYTANNIETIIDTSPYMTVLEGEYTADYRSMGSNEITCYYNFDNNSKIISVDYPKELNHEYSRKSWDGFTGDIYFYNLNTKKYDLIFDSKNMGRFKDLDNYLDENNNLLVKYVVSKDITSEFCTLPYITMVREVK